MKSIELSERGVKSRKNLYVVSILSIFIGAFNARLESAYNLKFELPAEYDALAIGMGIVLIYFGYDYYVRIMEDMDNVLNSGTKALMEQEAGMEKIVGAGSNKMDQHQVDLGENFESYKKIRTEELDQGYQKLNRLPIQRFVRDRVIPYVTAVVGFVFLVKRIICN